MEFRARPTERRQLFRGGPLILWRSKPGHKAREGLLCTLSACTDRDCILPHLFVGALAVPDSLVAVNRDVATGQLSLRLRDEGWRQESTCSLTVDLSTGDVSGSTAGEEGPRSGASSSIQALPADPKHVDVIEWLRSELDGALLESLYDVWLASKGWKRGTDGWQSQDWSWWDPGDLVPAADLLPGDRPDEYLLNGVTWLVVDYHCVTAGCDCREVRLEIVRIENQRQTGKAGGLRVSLPDERLLSCEPGECSRDTLEQLWAMYQRRHRGLERLAKRDVHAKRCGAELFALRGEGVKPGTGQAGRVGRNERCPCGSGKKFKHCCGKAVESSQP